MKKNSALANLGWPFSMMEQEGTLNWSIQEFEPEERFGQAMVSAREGLISAFASVRRGDGSLESEVELAWRVKDGMAHEERSLVNGKADDFGAALEAFQLAISRANEPRFEPSGGPAKPISQVEGLRLKGGAL